MHDVVVVGGGIAGLSAAWSLRELDVVVLEASDRPGGRIRSERRGRYWLNLGAHVFAGPGTPTDRLLREAEVEAVPIPGVLTAVELHGRVVAGGRVETYPLRLPLRLPERVALVRAGLRLRRAVSRYDRVLRTGDQEQVLAFMADETFAHWLGPVPDAVDALIRPTLQRSSAEPEELAAGYGIGYFHLVWDRSGGLARALLGGPSSLPEAIAASLGERVRTGVRVREVVADGGGVRVESDGGELRARCAVLAVPAHATLALAPGLPAETAAALRQVVYGPYVVAAFLTRETSPAPWDGLYAVATARRSFNLLINTANVVHAREERRAPGGSLMAYSAARLARRLSDADDAEVAAAYLEDLDGVFPGAGDLVEETVVHRWEHGLPYVRPGRYRVQRTLEQPLGNVFLAGDYLGSRYTDTAIRTGTAAAEAIRARIGPRV
ncbi:MAG TPA: NAD(P)/FAD-dependent oxidoreductase [Gaiellaceae bacterium]|nr:NAD(P)/FAD-dependent oxidoreductase [Gaiellaceae bacterium]